MSYRIGDFTFKPIPNVPHHFLVLQDAYEEPRATASAMRWTGKSPSFDKADRNATWALHEYEPDTAGHKGPLIGYFKSPKEIVHELS